MCECCEHGHMISSFSPRAYCQLCKHPYNKQDGSPIILDGDEIIRITDGRATRLQEFIEKLERAVEDWDNDSSYEYGSHNIQYASGIDRCTAELEQIINWYNDPLGRKKEQ